MFLQLLRELISGTWNSTLWPHDSLKWESNLILTNRTQEHYHPRRRVVVNSCPNIYQAMIHILIISTVRIATNLVRKVAVLNNTSPFLITGTAWANAPLNPQWTLSMRTCQTLFLRALPELMHRQPVVGTTNACASYLTVMVTDTACAPWFTGQGKPSFRLATWYYISRSWQEASMDLWLGTTILHSPKLSHKSVALLHTLHLLYILTFYSQHWLLPASIKN